MVKHGKRALALVDPGHAGDVIAKRLQTREKIHSFGDIVARAEEVEHVAFVAKACCLLDDQHAPAAAAQPPGQGQAGDPGSANDCSHRSRRPASQRRPSSAVDWHPVNMTALQRATGPSSPLRTSNWHSRGPLERPGW